MNKKTYYFLSICIFLALNSSLSAQVVIKTLLTENHTGILTNTTNFPNQKLKHEWIHKKQLGLKSTYQLNLSLNNNKLATYDVRMRNLSIAFYIEIRMIDQDGQVKTLSGIYDKGNNWLRIKMAPAKECLRDDVTWDRRNKIQEMDQILEFIIKEMDQNLILSCYL